MASAATSRHSSGESSDFRRPRGAGLVVFAAVVLAVLGSFSLLDGIAAVGLNSIAQMFFLASYPLWSIAIIAIDLTALYALCVYDSRPNLGTRRAA
jgi:hypothetical protein